MAKKPVYHTGKTFEMQGITPAVRCGNMLYISGQGPLDLTDGRVLSGSIEEETKITLQYIENLVIQAGGTRDCIVKCTSYLADLNDFEGYHRTYADFFKDTAVPPVRTTVQAPLLRGIRVEIDAIADLSES